MRLTQFRIRNFRSIVDSGWNNLSPDNITALIGQNESGKTSVLEALQCFHEGPISEDVLRSDLSMPLVSCRFKPDDDNFDLEGTRALPPGVLDAIKKRPGYRRSNSKLLRRSLLRTIRKSAWNCMMTLKRRLQKWKKPIQSWLILSSQYPF